MAQSWLHVQVGVAPDPTPPSPKRPTDEKGWFESIKDSFKEAEDGPQELAQSLSDRHIQTIAIGSAIGSGLFVGTASPLSDGGPGFLLLGYTLVGIATFLIAQSLAELVCVYPVKGALTVYATRFISPACGFAMGWNYALQWLVDVPIQISAAGLTIRFWDTHTSPAVYIAVFWVVVVAANLLSVHGTLDLSDLAQTNDADPVTHTPAAPWPFSDVFDD